MATAAAMETDSSTSATTPLFLLCTATVVISLSLLLLSRTSKSRLPPGPSALLFLARFMLRRRSIFEQASLLRDLHARYGPVISLRLSRTLVFVADRRVAHKILVKGGATFADRPPPVDPYRLFTAGGRDVSSAPYGAYWRLVRHNLAAKALQPARVALFAPARRCACDSLVDNLLRRSPRAGDDGKGGVVVTLRPFLRRAMFELLVYMCFGARLGQEELDEIEWMPVIHVHALG